MSTSSDQPVHLLVLVHGMWGNPGHLAEMDRIYNEIRGKEDSIGPSGERLHTMLPQTNKEAGTYDGVDWCGERVAEEVLEEVKKLEDEGKTVTRISVTGYSLGGLIVRYLIGVLHQRKFFEKVTPVNFTTVATPHIGLLHYPTFRSKVFSTLGTRLLSRTGEQFYAKDKWSATGRPLLEVMADPNRVFFQALALFHRIRFYANAVNDMTVPYMTAAVESEDIFVDHEADGLDIEYDENYSPIVRSWSFLDTPLQPTPGPRKFSLEWFRNYKPPLPPFLQKKFPFNILILATIPILFPTFLTLVVVRLSLDSCSSRSRIRTLEKDETYRERLAHVIGELEKRVEDAVADYIEDPGDALTTATSTSPTNAQSAETLAASPDTTESDDDHPQSKHKCSLTSKSKSKSKSKPTSSSSPKKSKSKSKHPTLTPLQTRIITSLNTLPNLKKHLAFINPIMNSHAVIISRDVTRFPHHEQGRGVLRHMADGFVM
ncbi:putative serine esterase-domain-containing protein [Irpex rosettiformis]|uniref:Serine esterase-domain-containing protein n=1 Tax=Irpex rosettiformis TaxID=378272 RepID=A0ACB8UBT7_9APHY|nr:putative serine esterase-domain-containing protein [Irpex rosettiformis]